MIFLCRYYQVNCQSTWLVIDITSMLSTGFSSLKTLTTRQPTWNPYIMFILFMTVLTIWKKTLNKFTIFVTSCCERMNRMGSFESLFFFSEESIREPEDDISWTARGLQAKRLTFKNLQKNMKKSLACVWWSKRRIFPHYNNDDCVADGDYYSRYN